MRAILNDFDPYKQVKMRMEALKLTGHPVDKIELIIIGGTWSFLPRHYQQQFILRCFQACNQFNFISNSKLQITNYKQIQNSKFQNLKQLLLTEQKKNEKAKHRIVGITIETRPDFINENEIKFLRNLGVTRVELGVQSIYDNVLKINRRGHTVKETIKATKLLKNAGFKICYHLMPNLPGSNLKKDKKMFKEIFNNPEFQPDLLKIYPCAVLKEAPIYNLWKNKKYKPYTEKQLINLLKEVKKEIPYYCRIQRLIRDIPSYSVITGPAKISNMRQILAKELKKEEAFCKCIRCREVKEGYDPKEKLYLFQQNYNASDGKEIFLSYESKDRKRLYSLLRLRIPKAKEAKEEKESKTRSLIALKNSDDTGYSPIFPVLKDVAIIRELHTYGQLQSLGHPTSQYSPQHKGLGKKLIKKAEKIAKKNGFSKIVVISGIGVKNYYRKLGYKLKDTYMVKSIKPSLD